MKDVFVLLSYSVRVWFQSLPYSKCYFISQYFARIKYGHPKTQDYMLTLNRLNHSKMLSQIQLKAKNIAFFHNFFIAKFFLMSFTLTYSIYNSDSDPIRAKMSRIHNTASLMGGWNRFQRQQKSVVLFAIPGPRKDGKSH